MITDEIRQEKKEDMDGLFRDACTAWQTADYLESSRIASRLSGFGYAFRGVDSELFWYSRTLFNRLNEFRASGATDFKAWAVGKACEVLKGLSVRPDPTPAHDPGPLDQEIVSENTRLATEYLAERPQLSGKGVVVIYNGEVSGWMNELRDPHKWLAGCYAVDPQGNQYRAFGGDKYNGATAWSQVHSAQPKEVAA